MVKKLFWLDGSIFPIEIRNILTFNDLCAMFVKYIHNSLNAAELCCPLDARGSETCLIRLAL